MLDARAYERELRPLLAQAGAYARSLLRSRHDAEDAVQQAALRGWERISQYDPSRPFKSWWFAVLRNCCFDALRRRPAPTVGLEGVDAPEPAANDRDDVALLEAALARLSLAHQDILRLRYHGGLNYDELAATLDIPKGTVMSRLHLARKALAEHMRETET